MIFSIFPKQEQPDIYINIVFFKIAMQKYTVVQSIKTSEQKIPQIKKCGIIKEIHI